MLLPRLERQVAAFINPEYFAIQRHPPGAPTIPLKHLAIIPDGNRRWSRAVGASLQKTYLNGCERMFELCKVLLDRRGSIEEVSLFFVSHENLKARSREELDPLFDAGNRFLDLFYSDMAFRHVDLHWVGLHDTDIHIDSTSYASLANRIRAFERPHAGTRRANVLFGYDVRRDIEQAMQKSDSFRYENLSVTRPIDLIIRSGGQKRLSGFLPLVAQYAEFEFIDKLFPEVEVCDVMACIDRFERSDRRFGV